MQKIQCREAFRLEHDTKYDTGKSLGDLFRAALLVKLLWTRGDHCLINIRQKHEENDEVASFQRYLYKA